MIRLGGRYDAQKLHASRNPTALLNLPWISAIRGRQIRANIQVTPGTGLLGGTSVRVIKAADTAIDDVAFSPDGRAVAAYVKYQGVFLWNLDAVPLSRVPVDPAENVYKGGLVFAPDGRSLAWLVEGARRIYDRDSRGTTTEKTFAAYRRVHDQALTLDGSQGLSLHGMPDYRLIGWRQVEGMWVQTWSHSTADKQVESLTLSADGSLFAMLTREALGEGWQNNPRQVEVREAATGTLRGTGEYRYKYGDKLLFSPDGRQLVGFNTMNLLVWPVPEVGNLGTPLLVRNTTRKQFTAMAYHPSGRHLYVTSNGDDAGNAKDATVHIFDTTSWTRAEQFTWKLGNLKAVAVSPDGTLAAAGSERGDLVIWDVDL
jgi:WD40 repeat protein